MILVRLYSLPGSFYILYCNVLWWRCATFPHPVGWSIIAVPGLSFRVRDGAGRFSWAVTATKLYSVALLVVGWRPDSRRECDSRGRVSVIYGRVGLRVCAGWCCCPLVPVSCACCHVSTSGLLTPWSGGGTLHTQGCGGILILEKASRLDAFSGYPIRT